MFTPDVARGQTIDAVTSVPSLPSGLPSGLLERRPDIQRAEVLLAASDLRIQQARTNYFPAFNLTGDFGSDAARIGNLFTSPAGIWGIGLGLVQPLLALKSIEAQVELAKANNDRAAVEYLQTVQNAFREVHDALVANRSARDVLAAETDRRNDLAVALDMANLRYNAGRTSYLEVLDAQRTLLAAETLRIGAARDARLSIVDFAKSLGGGWTGVVRSGMTRIPTLPAALHLGGIVDFIAHESELRRRHRHRFRAEILVFLLSNPGSPLSAIVGTFGNALDHFAVLTPSATIEVRDRPACR